MHRGGARATLLTGIVLGALLMMGPTTARAGVTTAIPEPVTSTIERYVRAEVEALGLPGASVTVVDGSGGRWSAAFGRAGEGRPMTARTPVLLASTSKAITAVAVAQAVEDGVLDLDVPVVEYLPWFVFDGPPSRPDASSLITARHLLAHTSGIPRRADVGGFLGGDDDADALEHRVRQIVGARLVAVPGARFEYSNANYDVLGLLVQQLSGRPFGDHVGDRVFDPLGMRDSYARASVADRRGAATGYLRWFGTWWRPTSMPRPVHSAPSATMLASSEDLGRFVAAHLARPSQVLSPVGWDLVHAPATEVAPGGAYAGGWYVHDLYRVRVEQEGAGATGEPPTVWEHTGTYPNSHTFAAFVPELDLGLAFVVNGNDLAIESRLIGINANLGRLLGGQEPIPVVVREPLLRTYAWAVAAVLLVAELAILVWSVRLLRRWRHTERPTARRQVRGILAPLLLDAAVAWLGLMYFPRRFETSVPEIVRLAPDVAVGLLPALVLAVVWGPVRTVLAILLAAPRR